MSTGPIRVRVYDRSKSKDHRVVIHSVLDAVAKRLDIDVVTGSAMYDVAIHGIPSSIRMLEASMAADTANVPPNTALMYVGGRKAPVGLLTRVGSSAAAVRHLASSDGNKPIPFEHWVDAIESFLTAASASDAHTRNHLEELVRQLYILLDGEDELLAALVAYHEGELRQAEATIQFLKGQVAALEAMSVKATTKWRDPTVVAQLVAALLTVLVPVGLAATDRPVGPQVHQVINQSVEVHAECQSGSSPTDVEQRTSAS